jgi:hypothetical protein
MFFLVPKKDGGQTPVINLKNLNVFLRYEYFKMEGIHLLKDLLLKDDWLVKIDLTDAYLIRLIIYLDDIFIMNINCFVYIRGVRISEKQKKNP